jgi:PPOX class probable F420-dependent enzyme
MLTSNPSVIEALDLAEIGFLTAVNEEGQPQTSPIWFLRQGEELIVYNRASSPRLQSLEGNPRVSLTLRGDRKGNGLLTIEGTAKLDHDLPPADQIPEYLAKYGEAVRRLGWTPADFAADYSVGITIRPTRVRAWGMKNVIGAETETGSATT